MTKQSATWGWSIGQGHYFSRTGELILEILRCLADEDPGPLSVWKTLEFEVQPHLRKKDGMIQEKLTDRLDWRVIGWKALEIAALLEAVKSGRIIVFEGKSTTDALRPLQTRKRVDADVDSLVADLSQG